MLAGNDPNDGIFPVSSLSRACTTETKVVNINFGGDSRRPITVIDTVGFDETENHAEERILADIIAALVNKANYVNKIGLVINGNSPRLNATTLSMLTMFENIFGDDFWKLSVLIFTNVSMDANSKKKRMRFTGQTDDDFARRYLMGLNQRFPVKDLQYLFLDACYNQYDVEEKDAFVQATGDLYSTLQLGPKLMTSTLHTRLVDEYPGVARFISPMVTVTRRGTTKPHNFHSLSSQIFREPRIRCLTWRCWIWKDHNRRKVDWHDWPGL